MNIIIEIWTQFSDHASHRREATITAFDASDELNKEVNATIEEFGCLSPGDTVKVIEVEAKREYSEADILLSHGTSDETVMWIKLEGGRIVTAEEDRAQGDQIFDVEGVHVTGFTSARQHLVMLANADAEALARGSFIAA